MMRLSGMGGHGIKVAIAVGAIAAMAISGTANAQKNTQSAWVKLCEKTPLKKAVKGGKTETINKNICLTHHERVDGNTGLTVVSAAIRQVEGDDKQNLMIMVPLGMVLQPGIKAAVYNKEQWARSQKNQEVKDSELKPISIKYSLCHPAGCTAEIEASKGMIDSMKSGGGLMVLSLTSEGRPAAFAIPLVGFAEAYSGKPADNAEYTKARRRMMKVIRERINARLAERSTEALVPEPKKN